MNKLYLVIIDIYDSEENSIRTICTSREVAEQQIIQFKKNAKDSGFADNEFLYNYHIDEIDIDYSKDILWDCYVNNSFNIPNNV